MKKKRLDKLVLERGLAGTREKAQALIMAGRVVVDETPVAKSGHLVREDANIRVTGREHPYVGRGGIKLAHALSEFKIDVKGKLCADIGASTGGFTDCLLQNGAAKVYAIDVGYNQLDWKLRSDPRVVVMEKTHVRDIRGLPGLCDVRFDIVVIDVSFISLTKVFLHVDGILKNDGQVVALIKPQFEAGRGRVGKGGVVRDEKVREECVDKVCEAANLLGWDRKGLTVSPITGADGNVEFLAWWVKR